MIGMPFDPHDEVRIGLVGAGQRGYGMLGRFLNMPGVRVTAIADSYEPRARSAAARVVNAGHPEPALLTGETGYEALSARDDVDFVYTATPWELHHPVAMTAMHGGKHVGVEVPLATDLRHLWELVDTSERTRRHCILMENVCYGRNELKLLKMAHAGVFGEVLHGSCGYIHDLRHNLFYRGNRDSTERGITWRRLWHTRVDANLYPTHGLGPIAADMDINRGDRFTRLTSTTSLARGLALYRESNVPPEHLAWQEEYINGDRNSSVGETAKGRRIRLEHDVTSPHPYTRLNNLVGTNGTFEDFTPEGGQARFYLEPEMTPHGWQWGSFDEHYVEYDHWLWKEIGSGGGGHGGIDYLMAYRLVQTMRLGLVPDIDVYDSAAWSAPFPLSALSLRAGGVPIHFPDFTRGDWPTYRPGLDSEQPA